VVYGELEGEIETFLAISTDSDPDNDMAIRLNGMVTPIADWFAL
jgi:hypothetical protein